MPAEVKVMAWKKGGRKRRGWLHGADGPRGGSQVGGGTVRIGGRVPWGAEVEYAYRAGYDNCWFSWDDDVPGLNAKPWNNVRRERMTKTEYCVETTDIQVQEVGLILLATPSEQAHFGEGGAVFAICYGMARSWGVVDFQVGLFVEFSPSLLHVGMK